MSRMSDTSKYNVACFTAVMATFIALVTGLAAFKASQEEPVKPLPRVGPASSLGKAEGFILRGVTGLSPKAPEIIWVDPNSGQGISEKFLFTKDGETPLSPANRRKVLSVVRENGLVRTEQYCRQVESKTSEWSLGYCVNRLLKDQEPASGAGPSS